MNTVLYVLLQIIIIIAVAPLVNGIIRKLKAFTQKRQGGTYTSDVLRSF